jgi:hypothetical protein
MLTNLLPGLRELRAPLAAGYCWLIACWILFEPSLPTQAPAVGVMASLYRLAAQLSPIGQVVVASVAAYVVGSISLTLFEWPLRQLFSKRVSPANSRWNAFTPQAASAIARLADEGRDRLEYLLALSPKGLKEFLDDARDAVDTASIPRWLSWFSSRDRPWFFTGRRWRRRISSWLQRNKEPDSSRVGPYVFDEQDPQRLSDRLVTAVVNDLPRVTSARLLGRDPDLYSAIDRDRAEVDFRLGLIPPVLGLTVAFVVRLGTKAGLATLLFGLLLVVGLLWDALKQQRNANDLLAEALADGRVKAPSLERLENSATEVAQRSTTDERRYAAIDATRAIAQAVRLTNLIASEPSRIYAAVDAVNKARDRFIPFEASFPKSVTERGARTLTALKDVTDLCVTVWEGKGADTPDWGTHVNTRRLEATAEYAAFRVVVSKELARLASLPVDPRSTAASSLRADATADVSSTGA